MAVEDQLDIGGKFDGPAGFNRLIGSFRAAADGPRVRGFVYKGKRAILIAYARIYVIRFGFIAIEEETGGELVAWS